MIHIYNIYMNTRFSYVTGLLIRPAFSFQGTQKGADTHELEKRRLSVCLLRRWLWLHAEKPYSNASEGGLLITANKTIGRSRN